MQKNCIFVFIFMLAGMAHGATWDYKWNCNEAPEDYLSGAAFALKEYLPEGASITYEVDEGVFTCETTNGNQANANASIYIKGSKIDLTSPSTIEFRLNNDSALNYYTNCFIISQTENGYCGFKFLANNQVTTYTNTASLTPYVDADGWSIFRITTSVTNDQITSASLYALQSNGTWSNSITSTVTTSSPSCDALTFGDIGSNWAGRWNIDYFAWTSQTATTAAIDEPEIYWQYKWDCLENPEDYLEGLLFDYYEYEPSGTTVTRSLASGVYTYETTADSGVNANSFFKLEPETIDLSKAMTFEFRLKNISAISYYTNCLFLRQEGIGYCGFKFVSDNKVNPYERNDLFYPYVDANGWTIYRMFTTVEQGQLVSAELYALDANGLWQGPVVSYVTSDPCSEDSISFGDIGSNWAGESDLDYFAWTTKETTFADAYDPYKLWEAEWYAEELPENFNEGSVFEYVPYLPAGSTITRNASDGVYTCQTTDGTSTNANSFFYLKDSHFDITSEMTIEFRLKNESALSYYTNCLFLRQSETGYCGFKFTADNRVNPYEYNDLLTPYVDADGWSTFRVTTTVSSGNLASATLAALNANGTWSDAIVSYLTSSVTAGNKINFGDIGSNWGGKWNIDSFYWKNETSTWDDIYSIMATPEDQWMNCDGGKIITFDADIETILSDPNEHLEFPWVERFGGLNDPNAVVWLKIHRGTHTVDEWSDYLWSLDDADTWQDPDVTIIPINCTQLSDGVIKAIGCWDTTASTSHNITVRTWQDPTTAPTSTTATVTLPFSSSFCAHRKLIQYDANDPDKIMFTAYGTKTGDSKNRAMCVRSTDGGQNFAYTATIAFDASRPGEGFNEPVLVRLENGSILCLMRTGINNPCMQSISTNGGISWSTPEIVATSQSSADPEVILLSNGALLASVGNRPGIDLFVDFSGTGNSWQEVNWPAFQGDGFACGYTSMDEVEPGIVMFITTESNFLGYPNFSGVNRLFKTYIKVIPDN